MLRVCTTDVKEALSVYLEVLICESVILFLPLMCNSSNIELTRPKGWICIFLYFVAISAFYYSASGNS